MKNVLITGASGGIGNELINYFLKKGDHVIAVSRSKPALDISSHKNLQWIVADINLSEGRKFVRQAVEGIQKLDILINNAGALINKPFQDISEKELELVYRANVFAPFHLIQELLPSLKNAEKAHVINIGSMGGFQGTAKFSGLTAYSSSKFALAGLTEVLAEEFKETNVAFNCLALGAAQTKMLEAAFPGYKAPVSAEEMASFIGDFASNAHHYIRGKIIPVSLSTP